MVAQPLTIPRLGADCPAFHFVAQMTYMQDQFKQFYINKHQNRRLMWQNSQGHCLLHAKFPKVRKGNGAASPWLAWPCFGPLLFFATCPL